MDFTEIEVQELSRQIDQRLQELRAQRLASEVYKSGELHAREIPEQESQAIEKVTGETAENFLKKFGRTARNDLCTEGGVLYEQWQKWRDLNNPDLIKQIGPILLGLGIAVESLSVVLVPVAVVVLHLTVKTFCEEYGHEP